MDAMRARLHPLTGTNFLVDCGVADPGSAAGGFSEVIFPPFTLEGGDPKAVAAPANTSVEVAESAVSTARLVLRRGATGSLDLYHWWDESRRARQPKTRTVTIQLLADDRRTVVLTWRFRGARPVALTYSPLRAMEGGIVMETLELAYDAVEME